jgi:hypothetical protein
MLAETVSDRSRTAVFAVYSLVGSLVAAAGSLAAGVPELLSTLLPLSLAAALQAMFALYALLGLATYYLYRRLPPRFDRRAGAPRQALGPSRRIVLMLAALFSLDAFGGGFHRAVAAGAVAVRPLRPVADGVARQCADRDVRRNTAAPPDGWRLCELDRPDGPSKTPEKLGFFANVRLGGLSGKAEWWCWQSDANQSPPEFPANREKYRDAPRFSR